MEVQRSAFIENVSLVNYKSIGDVHVTLRPLTVVVGRNGSGKSNFLDSLHFVAEALLTTLGQAISTRGGAKALTHRWRGPRLRIEISFRFADDRKGTYALVLEDGLVEFEKLEIDASDELPNAGYERAGVTVRAHVRNERLPAMPAVFPDRLALVSLSGHAEFREAFDALSSMRFYRFNPEAMRGLQDPDEGTVLREDGSNIASVWRRLQSSDPAALERLEQFLGAIVPEIGRIRPVQLGPKETLYFHQSGAGLQELEFYASSMSDGTLRALGALVASRQGNGALSPAVVGIEEPETALHPGAVAALMDALHEASAKTQIIITSHSPDLLDHVDIDTDALLVTDLRDGATTIAAVDGASRAAIRRDLYTPGELLRMDQLQPAEAPRG
ncbi:MAG: AAA family ATPase [Acidobacteriota bacterium]|nr:AAA family ATPase [Acidobacteriota bacterium]